MVVQYLYGFFRLPMITCTLCTMTSLLRDTHHWTTAIPKVRRQPRITDVHQRNCAVTTITDVQHRNCAVTLTTDVKYIWSVITTAGDCHHKKDIHTSTCYLKCQNKYWRTAHILSTITMYNWRRRAQNLNHHHNHRRISQKPYCLHSNWRTALILYCHQVKLMTYSTTILTFT